ncbi:MAG: NAD(P)-dependent oxidoreductase [Geminicoccaceae bacterium]
MEKFRVALSGDFRKLDGSPAYPDFDLGPLTSRSDIEVGYVQPKDGIMPAADLAGYDALILLTPRFARSSVPPDGRLAMVARFGVGYDNVDLDACNANGIAAVITPDGVRRPVAVTIITYILALSQKLAIKDRICRQGPSGWAQRSSFMGEGIVGKTLGQLGIGNIGAEVFRLAKPFDMRFLAHDPYADRNVAKELGIELVDMDELFARSDFVSISVPLSDATRHLVSDRLLGLMKPTAYLINTARGPIVDQVALYRVLRDRRIAGAALDVFEIEPAPADEPILQLDNVIVTPHSLCWTDQCFAGIGAADVAACLAMAKGEVPRGIVNRTIVDDAAWKAKLERLAKRAA